MLLRARKPVVLAVNKADQVGRENPDIYEFYNLGLGDPIAVSAVHGHGTGDLLDACFQYFPPEEEEDEEDDVIKVAIIGKPNVGKSSLVNRILGQERVIVSDVAGTTRDAVDSYFETSRGNTASSTPRHAEEVQGGRPDREVLRPALHHGHRAQRRVLIMIDARRGSRSRTPRWPVWPTRRARPASSW